MYEDYPPTGERQMKNVTSLVFALLLFTINSTAIAVMYEWTDKSGNMHISDSMDKIPDEYRAMATIRKDDPSKGSAPSAPNIQPAIPGQPPQVMPNPASNSEPADTSANELYGDYTLGWWKDTLDRKRSEIQRAEARIAAKEQYNRIYENGIRKGQLFEAKDTQRYNQNVTELQEENKKLSELKSELEDIIRKATSAGVPRKVRGEE